MKPVYLEFCGINSFSEKAQIDFRALLSGGVFGVFGDTGSGKSTLLDCIHLALYGKMERSGGNEYINYNADRAYVIFDFEITIDGKKHAYRVQRERRRTANAAKAFLYEYDDAGKLLALAEGTRDVDEKLESILGLTFADFKTCIALPQGDFAALVQATTSDRVKLVSRLFDLEKYGERLSKAVNDKYYRAEEECNVVLAKMGENEGCDEEVLTAKKAALEELERALSAANAELELAEGKCQDLEKTQEEKRAYEALEKDLQNLTSRLTDMEGRRAALEKIPLAKAVEKDAIALENNRKEGDIARKRAERGESDVKAAEETLAKWKKKQAEARYDENILQLSLAYDKVKAAAGDIEEEKKAKERYEHARQEYKDLKDKLVADDFDGKIQALEAEIEKLGEDGSLLDYLRRNCKGVFAREAYGEFREDLRILSDKHPTAGADIQDLIEKYTPGTTDDENPDIAEMNLAFKASEQKKKRIRTQIDELKKAKIDFAKTESALLAIEERGKTYGEVWNGWKSKIAAVKELGDLTELESRLSALKKEKEDAQKRVDNATERLHALRVDTERQKGLCETCEKSEKSLAQNLRASLQESGFSSVAEARALLDGVGDADEEKRICAKFFEEYALTKNKYAETDGTKFANFDEGALFDARTQKADKKRIRDELQQNLADGNAAYKLLEERRKRYLEFEKEYAEKTKNKKLCEELRSLLKGNKFLEFIAAEYLQEICIRASKILLSLTAGRYFLRYDKEFRVGDNLDGGNFRAVKTLSGGETFLVSLSLALALSGELCVKSRRSMEFFFLDEGFGTLDGKLVDTVMDVLTKLSKDFAVGLISHVEELKHRIENKILVTGATEKHGSQVKVENF